MNERVTGATVRTGNEGITKPAVGRIEQLITTGGAKGGIGREDGADFFGGGAGENLKGRGGGPKKRGFGLERERIHARLGGETVGKLFQEGVDFSGGAFEDEPDQAGSILNRTAQPRRSGQPVERRAEPDTLNNAPNVISSSDHSAILTHWMRMRTWLFIDR
jgi:hypothetical protein